MKHISSFLLSALLSSSAICSSVTDEMAKELSELLAIPSVSGDVTQNDRATEWMHRYLTSRGVWCAIEQSPEDGRRILYAATRPNLKNPDYILVTHLDVVDAPADQFRPRTVKTKLYARGAADTKGMAYVAAQILVRLNGKASVGCIFSANEEVGGSTTGHMVSLGYGVPGKMMFVFDGGGPVNQIRYACKGCSYYKVTAFGKSGHASRPAEADNPIYKLAEAALKIKTDYPFAKKGEWGNVAAVTIIGGGDAQNRIPEEASMTVNVRFVEENGLEVERERIARITGLKTELIRGTPAAVSKTGDPEFKRLQAHLQANRPDVPVKLVRGSGANDSRYFPQFGKPMVAVGGVDTHGSHSDDEWIDLKTIDPFIGLFCDFVTASCSSDRPSNP